jgi:hypothetical protein
MSCSNNSDIASHEPADVSILIAPEALQAIHRQFVKIAHITPFSGDVVTLEASAQRIVQCVLACRNLSVQQLAELSQSGLAAPSQTDLSS